MAQTDTPKPEITFWPPRDYAVAHKVKSEENWWKLAELYGRADPWDIIRFNFLTDNPLYVNYYLYKYVGCRKETQDHNNYRFSTDDSPGFIYIPREDWRPPGALDPESEIARRTVLSVLAGANLAAVSFSY